MPSRERRGNGDGATGLVTGCGQGHLLLCLSRRVVSFLFLALDQRDAPGSVNGVTLGRRLCRRQRQFTAAAKAFFAYFLSTGCTQPAVRIPGDGRKLR